MRADGRKIEILMARSGMTLQTLAMDAKVSVSTFGSVKAGNNARFTTIGRIARALGADVTDIIIREPIP